jgi:hypothetical protein
MTNTISATDAEAAQAADFPLPELGRRAALAAIALADAPVPTDIRFDVHPNERVTSIIYLHLESIADLRAWALLLGEGHRISTQDNTHSDGEAGTLASAHRHSPTSWSWSLRASDPISERDELEESTRTELARVALAGGAA